MTDRRIRWIAVTVGSLLLAGGAAAAAAYAYDSSRSDRIASGVTVAGIPVGGLQRNTARTLLEQRLAPRLSRVILLSYRGQLLQLQPTAVHARLDVDSMVRAAMTRSREGSLISRVLREVRDKPVHAALPIRVVYSKPALAAYVAAVGRRFKREPRTASITPSATALAVVPSHLGLAVRRRILRRLLARRLDRAEAAPVRIRVRILRPPVTTAQLERRYPWFITISRSTTELRLFRRLRLYKTYTIAVGRIGLETPAGLYHVQDKQIDPSWHVPNSPWAGSLAGRVIPPGPDDPLKARWLGFYDGAGIHGTDDVGSLGTAASHGCIRMSIPDVTELYDLVPLRTAIYIA